MAKVSRRSWDRYSARQAAQRQAASDDMVKYVTENARALRKAALVTAGTRLAMKHGRSAAALACVWYEQVARKSAAKVDKAVPVVSANKGRIAALVESAAPKLEAGDLDGFAKACGDAVASEVKRSATRTMTANARRDGVQFAWVPNGAETCAFCITLASNGWQYASEAVMNGMHEEHIHPNCECEFAIRFSGDGGVDGYDPDEYWQTYKDAEGRSSKDKINSIRRDLYQENKDKINAQHRERYAALHQTEE